MPYTNGPYSVSGDPFDGFYVVDADGESIDNSFSYESAWSAWGEAQRINALCERADAEAAAWDAENATMVEAGR